MYGLRQLRCFSACWLAAVLLAAAGPSAATASEPLHLGVATCASSTCHGRVRPSEDSDLALNEYFIWSKYDAHSEAYQVLKNDRSERIAANMGLGEPTEAPECLVCHSDYVPRSQRGPKFQLSDGVGCEACHGGAENWIAFHYSDQVSHAENLQRGMWPTADVHFLAGLCQSCHLGDQNQLATHEMMAAGHPRLRFELDTWLANMPPHHVVDADYRQRKPVAGHVDRWAAGVAASARGYLRMLPAYLDSHALMPELALFDCQSCHRPMNFDVLRTWQERRLAPAGTVRPDDHAIRMLAVIIGVRNEELADAIRNKNIDFHHAASGTTAAFLDSASELLALVELAGRVTQHETFNEDERDRLRRALLQAAANGFFRDYAGAEQLFLALQVLAVQDSLSLDHYDDLFQLLSSPRSFDPQKIAAEARDLLN